MANATLCSTVTDILSRATITENLLVLPTGQLERKLYEKVAKAIQLAGGKWKTNKQGFVFDSDPRAKLGLALETGVVVDEKKLRQAFYTPEVIANEVARMANLDGHLVLELSAGDGALAKACLAYGASSVDTVEIDEETARKLKEEYIPTKREQSAPKSMPCTSLCLNTVPLAYSSSRWRGLLSPLNSENTRTSFSDHVRLKDAVSPT